MVIADNTAGKSKNVNSCRKLQQQKTAVLTSINRPVFARTEDSQYQLPNRISGLD